MLNDRFAKYSTVYTAKMNAIYNALQDEVSREIFTCRYLFQLTGDSKHLAKMCFCTEKSAGKQRRNTMADIISALSVVNRKVVMYGCGNSSVRHYYILKGMNLDISCFCDSDLSKVGSTHLGLPVISPEELVKSHKNNFVFISSSYYVDDIYKILISLGFPTEQVFIPGEYKEQYFGEDFFCLGEKEIYVDAGSYTGDSIKRFIKYSENKYEKIYGLEPSLENYKALSSSFLSEDRVILINKGAWSKSETLAFNDNTSCSSILDSGSNKVDTTTIDSIVGDDAVTLIKMDIEGAELEALKGAKDTIRRYKPRLAISIYHNPEDIITIPLYIHELVPEYLFYIRHYAPYPDFSETILYAI